MSWWRRLFGKEKKLNAREKTKTEPTPPRSLKTKPSPPGSPKTKPAAHHPKKYLNNITSTARKAAWYNPSIAKEFLEPIKNTWGVDCTIFRLTKQQVQEIEQQYPLDTNFTDTSRKYYIRLSPNSIFIHEHGAWIDFGYLKFLYHDDIYYVNVDPTVQITTSFFKRMDDLSHMAKIMAALVEHGRSDRESFLISLKGDLVQDLGDIRL